MVWYSHLFQNFPQLIVIHTVKGFGIVNKAEIFNKYFYMCFSGTLAFLMIQQMLAIFTHGLVCAKGLPNPLVTSCSSSRALHKHHFLNARPCSFVQHEHRVMTWRHIAQICNYTPSSVNHPLLSTLLCYGHCSRHLRSTGELNRQKSLL